MVPTPGHLWAGVAKGFLRSNRTSGGERWPKSQAVGQEARCFGMDVSRAGCCPSGGLCSLRNETPAAEPRSRNASSEHLAAADGGMEKKQQDGLYSGKLPGDRTHAGM